MLQLLIDGSGTVCELRVPAFTRSWWMLKPFDPLKNIVVSLLAACDDDSLCCPPAPAERVEFKDVGDAWDGTPILFSPEKGVLPVVQTRRAWVTWRVNLLQRESVLVPGWRQHDRWCSVSPYGVRVTTREEARERWLCCSGAVTGAAQYAIEDCPKLPGEE